MSLPLRPEVQALVRIRPVVEWFAHSFLALAAVCARFYQAEPAPVVGTTKCPESLCLMLALPPSERRVPPLPRTLLLVHRSYGLMRQSRVALPYFGFWPRSRSLRRLLPAPAATGILPTLSLQICHRMPGPLPRRSHRVHLPVSSSVSSAFPRLFRSASRWYPRTRFVRGLFLEVADISLCSGLRFCSPPRSLLPLRIFPQGSRGSYIRAYRASLPPHAPDMLSVRIQEDSILPETLRAFSRIDESACNPKPKNLRQGERNPFNRRFWRGTAYNRAYFSGCLSNFCLQPEQQK